MTVKEINNNVEDVNILLTEVKDEDTGEITRKSLDIIIYGMRDRIDMYGFYGDYTYTDNKIIIKKHSSADGHLVETITYNY